MAEIEKNSRQRIVDGSTLFGVFLTLIGLAFGLPQLMHWQKIALILGSLYFLVFALAEIFGVGYKEPEPISKEKKEDSKPHFAKIIDYAPQEPWRTDILMGQKGSKSHGHIAASGAQYWHIEDENRNVIVENGKVVGDPYKRQED